MPCLQTSHWSAVLLLALALTACGTDGPTDTGTTGAIRVTLSYQGSGDQRSATVTLVGVDRTPTVTGTVFLFSGLAPDTYVVEPSDVPAGCRLVGAGQDTLTVVVGATADALFTLRCPAGDQLLVLSQSGSYALVNADGTGLHDILTNLGFTQDPNWSPDGQRLAFLYAPSAQDELGLWTINIDGTGLSQVYPGSSTRPLFGVRWAPDGAHFAIRRSVYYNSFTTAGHLHIVTAGGGNEVQLPQVTELSPDYFVPDWSPTGDRLAVGLRLRDSLDNLDGFELHTFRPDGTDERTIHVGAEAVRWSPAGDRIAYSPGSEIYSVRPDGTDGRPVRLGFNFGFDWAPDGSRLAIVADDGVRVVNVDGSNDVLVFPATDVLSPASVRWSPSGNKLAVVASRLDSTSCCPQKVIVMNVDGSDPVEVSGETGQQIAIWRP